MKEFRRQQLVNLHRVVPISSEMTPYHGLELVRGEVRAGKRPRLEQHFPNVVGQGVPVPNAEMGNLVPAQEDAFEAKWCQEMIDSGHPLGHPVVVGVFGFKRELKETARYS